MFCFCHLKAFYDFKVVNSIKIAQKLLKNGQRHEAKNNRSEHFVSHWIDTIHLHCRFNECGIKLLIVKLTTAE